jgi:uncharacterized protein (UPF0548 family)
VSRSTLGGSMRTRSAIERGQAIGPPWLAYGREIRPQLELLSRLAPNFGSLELPEVAFDAWHVDDYCHPLPPEPPGDPLPDGSFETARRLLRDYEFADPKRIRSYYWADAPLEARDMLLEIRYLLLRVRVGVRISEEFDEVRQIADRAVRVWGWAYQTLEGHLERGQMDYQVWKWLDTGEVQFRIHAVSEIAEVRNPILSLGFRLVGRREQVRFARRSAERMERLVEIGLAGGSGREPRLGRNGRILVSPSADRI